MKREPSQTRRLLLAGALSAASMAWADDARAPLRMAFVSHAPDSDVWWNVVRNAIKHASEDFGVEVDYLNPSDGSIAGMVKILDGLDASRYVGVISTIADYTKLSPALMALRERKLPLITVNSGSEAQSESVGAILHIGQPEFIAGKAAGQEMAKLGAHSFICFNHYPSNPASTERCEGFLAGLGEQGRMTVVPLTGDSAGNQATVAAALQKTPGADVFLALGPTSAHPVLAASRLVKSGKVPPLVSFDISPDIVAGIRSGSVLFSIDQQPYLQGYLSVALMAQVVRWPKGTSVMALKMAVYSNAVLHQRMSRYGLSLRSGDTRHVHSGPGFVNRINVDKVERFSGQFR